MVHGAIFSPPPTQIFMFSNVYWPLCHDGDFMSTLSPLQIKYATPDPSHPSSMLDLSLLCHSSCRNKRKWGGGSWHPGRCHLNLCLSRGSQSPAFESTSIPEGKGPRPGGTVAPGSSPGTPLGVCQWGWRSQGPGMPGEEREQPSGVALPVSWACQGYAPGLSPCVPAPPG